MTKETFTPLIRGIAAACLLLLAGQIVWRSAVGGDPAGQAPPAAVQAEETDPLGANAACYVCHIPFVKEELAKTHLAAKVACVKCHGLSDKHANDENVGATKPDVVYKRSQIDASCAKCHDTHDVPARKVIARALHRRLPAATAPVCTDCHGTHKIEKDYSTLVMPGKGSG